METVLGPEALGTVACGAARMGLWRSDGRTEGDRGGEAGRKLGFWVMGESWGGETGPGCWGSGMQ